jgi:UDP-glucose 4-epimerase
MKRLVITGALGHIGSRYLHGIAEGRFSEVRIVDNLSTQRYSSLFNLPESTQFSFIEGDILDTDLDALLQNADVCIHMAAITNAVESFQGKELVEKVNCSGAGRVARACARSGARLIFLSTTSVYGTQSEIVDEDCTEDDLKPQSPYAQSKLDAEKLIAKTASETGLDYAILRLGTIFGTSVGMRFHTAVNKFCWQACLHQPITVWRTAMEQHRPYLDLGDAVRALDYVIDRGIFDRRVYNVLTANLTVHEIIDAIRAEVPDLSISYVDSPIMNQLSYTVRCERFAQEGFRCTGNLKQGISQTVELLRSASHLSAR